jgi:hypothetical protein
VRATRLVERHRGRAVVERAAGEQRPGEVREQLAVERGHRELLDLAAAPQARHLVGFQDDRLGVA